MLGGVDAALLAALDLLPGALPVPVLLARHLAGGARMVRTGTELLPERGGPMPGR